MHEHEPFLDAIAHTPADDGPRLIYADWLEEQSDIRGEYLRLIHQLAALRPRSKKGPGLRRRLIELRTQIEPSWLAFFDQPQLLRVTLTPFPAGWWGIELPDRVIDATYLLCRYETLPPLPVGQFRGNYRWLEQANPPFDEDAFSVGERAESQISWLRAAAKKLHLKLPVQFTRFMQNNDLQQRVRSCTACYFDLAKNIVECPGGEDGYILRFYSDQQGCCHWYLYLNPNGFHCVVVSGGFFGGSVGFEGDEDVLESYEQLEEQSLAFFFCAPSFEAFVYRWWIENEIWYAQNDGQLPMTPEQEAYLNHYRT